MKILIKFNKNYICFYDYLDYKDHDLARTNILDYNDIALSDTFIIENYNFVVDFIKKNIAKRNINKVYIDKLSITETVLIIIKHVQNINYLFINEEKKVNTDIFNYVLNNKNIKVLDCYDINPITFDRLNLSRKLEIKTRKEIYDNSYLYRINNIKTYSDLFYKNDILIDKQINKTDLKLFEKFIKGNIYLKNITFKYFDHKDINSIINILKKYNKKNIHINILQNDVNVKKILKNVDSIKKNKYLKNNNIKIKVTYEDKYIKKNIFSQLNINYIKATLTFIIICVTFILTSNYIINEKKVDETKELSNKINEIVTTVEPEIIEPPTEEVKPVVEEKKEEPKMEEQKKETPKKEVQPTVYTRNYSTVISELKKINKEAVGWLKINNTSINYPVVKTTNNEKYLNISFDNSKNLNGWIFMDYRNNPNTLDQNTIIYGHSGNYYVMFGSLRNVLNSNWYKNKNNQIITFNTESGNYKWQIISIYTVNVTNDYLINNFSSDESFMNFINKIKSRSIYNFGVNVSSTDKILTLSTCYKDSNKRLVVHAKKL